MSQCNALLVEDQDNVCVVTEAIEAGQQVCFLKQGELQRLAARESIPIYFKMAVKQIDEGEVVRKYNQKIGLAVTDIAAGALVHTHNLASG